MLGKEESGVPGNSGYCILADMHGRNFTEERSKILWNKSQIAGTCKKPSILSIAVACPRLHPCASTLARNHGSQKRYWIYERWYRYRQWYICSSQNFKVLSIKPIAAVQERLAQNNACKFGHAVLSVRVQNYWKNLLKALPFCMLNCVFLMVVRRSTRHAPKTFRCFFYHTHPHVACTSIALARFRRSAMVLLHLRSRCVQAHASKVPISSMQQ